MTSPTRIAGAFLIAAVQVGCFGGRRSGPEADAGTVVREYRSDLAGISAGADVKLSVGHDPQLADEALLLVDYPPPDGNPASRDVRIDSERRDWSSGRTIAFRVRPAHATRMSVSFIDRNGVVYTAWRDLGAANTWQSLRIPFAALKPNPYFQPPGAKTGSALDVSDVGFIAFAPQDSTSGRLALSRMVIVR